MMAAVPTLGRTTFRTSRLLEFCTQKELTAQTGHGPDDWPLVILKELVDNSLDAVEETGAPPHVAVQVSTTEASISVTDNGPGLHPDTVAGLLDFSGQDILQGSVRLAHTRPAG